MHEQVEERLEKAHIVRKDRVVHAALLHGAARHQEAVFHAELHAAFLFRPERRVADGIKAVGFAGIGKGGNIGIRAQHSPGKERRVRSARDIKGAVVITPGDLTQLALY